MTAPPDFGAPTRVLELSKVGKQYGSEPAVHALVDVDLALDRGEWLSITGPSGAGKSTLLNIIGCLDRPTTGTYLFDGIDTAELTDNQRAGLRSQRIGFVFQSFHLLPYRTVLENVMLAEVYRKHSHRERRERALAALARVGLSHRVDFLPGKLSGGEQQRVAIARALVGSPSLLVCDEPTGNLDSKTSANLLDLFESLNKQGFTLVIVTHDEKVANRASRRVHIIDGRLTDITVRRETGTKPAEATVIRREAPHFALRHHHARSVERSAGGDVRPAGTHDADRAGRRDRPDRPGGDARPDAHGRQPHHQPVRPGCRHGAVRLREARCHRDDRPEGDSVGRAERCGD